MDDFFGGFFVIIWLIAIFSFIARTINSSKGGARRPNQRPSSQSTQQQNAQQNISVDDALDKAQNKQSFRQVPNSTGGTTRQNGYSGANTTKSRHSGYGQGAFAKTNTRGKVSTSKEASYMSAQHASKLGETGVLLEDRRNDWLAKQLREEAAIKRRGSIYDLGAAHDADCDAEKIRLFHIARHNTNGLNRQTFK